MHGGLWGYPPSNVIVCGLAELTLSGVGELAGLGAWGIAQRGELSLTRQV